MCFLSVFVHLKQCKKNSLPIFVKDPYQIDVTDIVQSDTAELV